MHNKIYVNFTCLSTVDQLTRDDIDNLNGPTTSESIARRPASQLLLKPCTHDENVNHIVMCRDDGDEQSRKMSGKQDF